MGGGYAVARQPTRASRPARSHETFQLLLCGRFRVRGAHTGNYNDRLQPPSRLGGGNCSFMQQQ